MIKVPDGTRKLLSSYIRLYEDKFRQVFDKEDRDSISNILEEFKALQLDLEEQKSEVFQGDEIDVMKNFVIALEQYDDWVSYDEKLKYFSEIIINPYDLQFLISNSENKRIKEIIDYMFNPGVVMCDGQKIGFKREFKVVRSTNQISPRAKLVPGMENDSIKVYYESVGMIMQISDAEWEEYLKIVSSDSDINLGDIYCKWYGLEDKGVYYVLINYY